MAGEQGKHLESESKVILGPQRFTDIKEQIEKRPDSRRRFGGSLQTTQFRVPRELKDQNVVSMRVRTERSDTGRRSHSWTIKLRNGGDTREVKNRDESNKGKAQTENAARAKLMRAARERFNAEQIVLKEEYTSQKRRDSFVVPSATKPGVKTIFDFDTITHVNDRPIKPIHHLEVEWPTKTPDMRRIAPLGIDKSELTNKSTKKILRKKGLIK